MLWGSVPEVVEKGIGISYPIEKPTNRKGGHADGERIPQGTGIDHVRAGVIAGRVEQPTTGVVCPGRSKAAADCSSGRGSNRIFTVPAVSA
jgi:hypothetical protein